MFFRIQSGEAVFQFELRPFRVNSRASAQLMQDLAFFPRFFRANDAILILSAPGLHCLLAHDCVRPRPDSPTLCGARAGPAHNHGYPTVDPLKPFGPPFLRHSQPA